MMLLVLRKTKRQKKAVIDAAKVVNSETNALVTQTRERKRLQNLMPAGTGLDHITDEEIKDLFDEAAKNPAILSMFREKF